ncbi:gliding motility protein GldD [Parabacteroides bouchesdurhonensis]|uniref:gliding motility lipoprotein GldD n=1 Tax=Parabacteroides bouchesdurhonensis TaxID=1936995 RepID=UPI000E48E0DA|nr:gliding motility protein GldD [Parabacteroides bouchesdurhonensis]RHJ92415.1 gliding motility protein GldD [Bacteroides sp. AM07-16]
MKKQVPICVVVLVFWCCSCTEYTPKPRGYFRIEPASAHYQKLPLDNLPYTFNVSQLSTVELPQVDNKTAGWINLSYPSLGAKIYCSYFPVTPLSLHQIENESRELVSRQTKNPDFIQEKAYSNPEEHVYGSLFLLDEGSASPIQFMLTDSVSNFFRGALYYDCKPNADSLAPVTQYLREDIIELIQSFSWKK